ncbi:hypothetical protein [Haliangium sp. UPWRP_2]|uniref:hypothetical protein n=1 Tax=Haliangium sp. UPWRP_2 TaxID=1931276 RepID=UPI000B541440|nr:hypothetical protein [Haliangium sp. UPWRP_2]PSM31422.1 hypothetical protein BVG81_005460 [Haliangium sp. UPWRP_2]
MASSELEKAAFRELQAKNKDLMEMVKQATTETAAVMRERDKLQMEQTKRLDMMKQVQGQVSPGTQVQIDLIGGGFALLSTELLNWGIRAAGDWSKTGWIARNNDLLQSIPHIGLGTLVYIAEMCMRPSPDKKLPSRWRLAFSEAAKLFAYSGFGNLARAVRYRIQNGKSIQEDNAALRAELAALKASTPKAA